MKEVDLYLAFSLVAIPIEVNLLEPFLVQQLVYRVILKIIDRGEKDNDILTPLSIIFGIMHEQELSKHALLLLPRCCSNR